ncbi:Enamine deaminase RidA, house cleaning of reactive enamine intermediates, YjgF/YER057c/UK114 family [Amycolatopsis regifaucium]|nr:Enamine deaminase RidA, house cleaning of reactive enamine intermediates, YjgF/YER057c/UK114 family [Amycolatopsis regifaucium]
MTIVEGRRDVHLAGQCPLAGDGKVVEGDVLAQVDQIVANTAAALAFAKATPADVVRTVIYVVTSDADALSAVWDRFVESEIGEAFTTASTLLGVAQLGYRGQLVELDVTAATA